MPHFRSSSDGKVLWVHLTEAKILDELVIRQVQDELLCMLEGTRELAVVLDFQFVEFLSSSALGMLIRVHKRCKDLKISLRLCNVGKDIQKVFKITGLNKVLDIGPAGPGDPPDESGVFAKLKPRPSAGTTAREPDPEEE